MRWIGKIVGGLVGALVGPVGAVIGAVIGHSYDAAEDERSAAVDPRAVGALPDDALRLAIFAARRDVLRPL